MNLFTSDKSKGFFGQVWEVISRFTWQAPQTWLGVTYSYFRNALGFVDEVHLYRGATYVVDGGSVHKNGLTLGSFINMNSAIIPVDGNGNFDPTKSQLYMHEYGHYLQSQDYGLGYIRIIAIPSLISAANSVEIPNDIYDKTTHKFSWSERDANKRAANYFWKNNGVSWNENRYPFEKLEYYFNLK